MSFCEEQMIDELRLQRSGTFKVSDPNKGAEENGSAMAVSNSFGYAFVTVADGE
jgi:hypothetical protein